MWLWQRSFKDEARDIEQRLEKLGLPSSCYGCAPCGGQSMLGKVALHLLSPSHVRHVARAAKLRVRGVAERNDANVQQSWDLPDGRRVTLHHLPLRLEVPTPAAPIFSADLPPMAAAPAAPREAEAAAGPETSWHQGRFAEGHVAAMAPPMAAPPPLVSPPSAPQVTSYGGPLLPQGQQGQPESL